MNLNEYEVTTRTIDRQKTWVDVKRRRIYSREIHGNYYNILSKINPISGEFDYFLAIFKDRPEASNIPVYCCSNDDFGRCTISLSLTNWNLLGFNYYKENTQISIKLVDSDETGSIYKIEN